MSDDVTEVVRHTTPDLDVDLSDLPDELFDSDFQVRVTVKPFFDSRPNDDAAVLNKQFTATAGPQRLYKIPLSWDETAMPPGQYCAGATAFKGGKVLAEPEPERFNFLVLNGPSNLPVDAEL